MHSLPSCRQISDLFVNHPNLVRWYFRNRARAVSVGLDRLNHQGISRPPRSITIKPTLSCNLRCKMCRFTSSGDIDSSPADALPLKVWTRFIDDIAAFHPYVSLTGGEPLLYPDICGLTAHIKRRGLVCTLTTNGVLLARHAERLMESPPDALIVSLDGPAEMHDEVRGRKGTFDRAVEGVRTVRRLQKERAIRSPLITINCAVTSFNYRSVPEMVGIAHDLGVNALNIQYQWSLTDKMIRAHNKKYGEVHSIDRDDTGWIETPPADPREVVEAIREVRRRSHERNGTMSVVFYPTLSDDEVLDWYTNPHKWVQRHVPACAWINAEVLPNGDVQACPGLTCGNITARKFMDIWNNETYRAHRKRLMTSGALPLCPRCCAYFRKD